MAASSKKSIKLMCSGTFNKRDECSMEFFYALKDDVDENNKPVTVVYVVDKSGCSIKNGNLIVLPHDSDSEVLFCDNVNEHLNLSMSDGGYLIHDEACIGDNNYIG